MAQGVQPGSTRRHALALALGGIIAVAAVARFATLDLQSYHHDEAVTAARVILPDLLDTLGVVERSERSPPLYYVLAWGWAQLWGTGEVGLRSLSALLGTLTVPAAYLAGRNLVGRAASAQRIGLIAAALVALNPYLIWYSQEARSYALVVLFVTLGVACFSSALREPTPRNLSLWAVASALALLSHYFAAFVVGAQAVWLITALGAQRARALAAVAAVAVVGCALLPLAMAQEGDDRRNAFADRALPVRAGEVAVNYVSGEEPDPLSGSRRVDLIQGGALLAGALLLSLAAWLVARRADEVERRGARLAALIAASAIAVPLALAVVGLDFVNPRNLVVGLVPLLLVAAVGFGCLRSGAVGRYCAIAAAAQFAAVSVAINLSEEMQREDWRTAASAMGTSADPRLIVTNRNGDDPLAYYLRAEKFEGKRLREGVDVREVQVLSTAFDVNRPRGFRLVSERALQPLFYLRSFRSPAPLRVRPPDLAGDRVLSERSAVLLDR